VARQYKAHFSVVLNGNKATKSQGEHLNAFSPSQANAIPNLGLGFMAKPILLCIDDDSDVLRAIERDLRSHYGATYRVLASDAPEKALELLKQLKVRNDPVALLLADQRMPKMDGVGFLQEARHIFPDA
jgi:PleD family two-component response regulator